MSWLTFHVKPHLPPDPRIHGAVPYHSSVDRVADAHTGRDSPPPSPRGARKHRERPAFHPTRGIGSPVIPGVTHVWRRLHGHAAERRR